MRCQLIASRWETRRLVFFVEGSSSFFPTLSSGKSKLIT